ncbi:MAG: hypothetical protein K2M68_02790 [Muribaculaceae bacterium]|nr:hypothetical protein [Muribaculaceae bacterium]
MKKFLLVFALLAGALSVSAQRAGEFSMWSNENSDINHSGFFLNPAIGLVTGDCEDDFGVSLQLGYRWHIASGFNWDIVKVGANTGVSNFTEMLDLRFLSGFRYNSHEILAGHSMYADVAFGYNFLTDVSEGGFAYEVGVGVNLTRTLSLGLVWEGSNVSYDDWFYGRYTEVSAKWGTLGVRLGINF